MSRSHLEGYSRGKGTNRCWLALIVVAVARMGLAQSVPVAQQFVSAFVSATNIPETVRHSVQSYWEDATTDARRAAVIPYGLAQRYPEYREALALHGKGETAAARERLTALLGADAAARDPYLCSYAHLDAARVAVASGDVIDALRHIETIEGRFSDFTAHPAEVAFIRALCEYDLLRRDRALASALEFLGRYPDASQAMRRMMAKIVRVCERAEDGSLEDVRDHMAAAGAHLSGDSGNRQKGVDLQQRVEEMLTALIGDGEADEAPDEGESPAAKQDEQGGAAPEPSGKEDEDDESESSQRQLQRLTATLPKPPPPPPPPPQEQVQSPSRPQSSAGDSSSQTSGGTQPGGQMPLPGTPGMATGTGPSMTAAKESALVGGETIRADGSGQDTSRVAGERWGEMPSREREKVLSVVGDSSPESYRDLVEQYYRGLMDGGSPASGQRSGGL